jgi:signal transduction histidine kinase
MKELAAWIKKNAGTSGISPDVRSGELRIAAEQHDTVAGRRRLLEVAAHDLRNPISGILTACQYLTEDATSILEPHQVLVLASIESSARVALQLIHALSEIPTIRLSEPHIELRPTDIVSVTEEAVSAVRPLADTMQAKIQVRVKDQVPVFEADPVRLTEALSGILVKAIERCDAGGRIEITVGTGAGEVRIALHREYTARPGEEIVVRGKPRHRGFHRRLSAIYAAMVWARAKQILKAHGGAVRVEGHAGHGQQWTVTLPVAVP